MSALRCCEWIVHDINIISDAFGFCFSNWTFSNGFFGLASAQRRRRRREKTTRIPISRIFNSGQLYIKVIGCLSSFFFSCPISKRNVKRDEKKKYQQKKTQLIYMRSCCCARMHSDAAAAQSSSSCAQFNEWNDAHTRVPNSLPRLGLERSAFSQK